MLLNTYIKSMHIIRIILPTSIPKQKKKNSHNNTDALLFHINIYNVLNSLKADKAGT